MRLTELDPHWVADSKGVRVGLSFDCPHCRTQRLAVPFHECFGWIQKPWNMSGDSFDNLSLSPSIDASASGHWHGFITNGEVT